MFTDEPETSEICSPSFHSQMLSSPQLAGQVGASGISDKFLPGSYVDERLLAEKVRARVAISFCVKAMGEQCIQCIHVKFASCMCGLNVILSWPQTIGFTSGTPATAEP